MNPKIKLSQIRKEDYVELAAVLNKQLKEMPIKLNLNLGELFVGHDYAVPITMVPYAEPIVERRRDYYEIGFGIRPCKDDKKQIITLGREGPIKEEVIKDWIRRDSKRKDLKNDFYAQEFLESLLMRFETDKSLFNSLVGHYYDVRYIPEINKLYASDTYSGRLKRQGLMRYLFRSIGEVVDFEDLDGIKIDGIVESNTTKMFDALAAKINEPQKICTALKSEYIKSPFMRLLYGLGYGHIELGTDRDSDNDNRLFICSMEGKKSDELKFEIHQEKD